MTHRLQQRLDRLTSGRRQCCHVCDAREVVLLIREELAQSGDRHEPTAPLRCEHCGRSPLFTRLEDADA